MTDEIKELPERFTKYGYKYCKIYSTIWGYVYSKTSDVGTVTFEIFKRLENKQYNCVSFPTDKAFGIWAWSYWEESSAIRKLLEIKPIKTTNI